MRGFVEFVDEKIKKKVVLVIGSARSPNCCPDEKSKTHKLADAIRKEFSKEVAFEVVDLSVKCDGVNVQPCKGCVSTSSLHCHWPCDCYGKKSDPKDLMHEQDVYKKLEESDGFFVITPINWSSCSSVVKSFFDRLVCASLSITSEQAESLMEGDIKNASKSRAMEKSGKYQTLLKNLDPLVRQGVYSGIFVPDDCVKVVTYGFGISYGEVNDLFEKENKLINEASGVFSSFLRRLGTV